MRRVNVIGAMLLAVSVAGTAAAAPAQRTSKNGTSGKASKAPALSPADKRLNALKAEAVSDIDSRRQFTQQMVDQIFSFGELGFQEFETSKYITDILRKNGFTVQEGVAGIPTAW